MPEPERTAEVVVGGGPAGAAIATRLATAGHEVVLFERFREPRWRACGVYASPRTRDRLAALGVGDAELSGLIRPISAINVESVTGARCRLDYSAHGGACGFDRVVSMSTPRPCSSGGSARSARGRGSLTGPVAERRSLHELERLNGVWTRVLDRRPGDRRRWSGFDGRPCLWCAARVASIPARRADAPPPGSRCTPRGRADGSAHGHRPWLVLRARACARGTRQHRHRGCGKQAAGRGRGRPRTVTSSGMCWRAFPAHGRRGRTPNQATRSPARCLWLIGWHAARGSGIPARR